MAYNFQPFVTILQQILNPEQRRWIVVDHDKLQLRSLLLRVLSLQGILEKSSLFDTESFESEIRDAAHEVEDIIESHMVDQILPSPGAVRFIFSTPDLKKVIKGLDSVLEQVEKLVEGIKIKSIVVGLDEDLKQLKERLTGMPRKLQIVPIVGMGGIGKTTLARQLYQDPLILEHFKYLAWAKISQDHNMREIVFGLLCCIIGKDVHQHTAKNVSELKDVLYRSLFGRRYMIVLDDIWKTDFWDDIRKYFPDNNNGSRILITTRESMVAKDVNSLSKQHEMQLLNKSDSWKLLRQKVFREKDYPAAFEKIGTNIARSCRGLPLAIHVIGGLLLSKANRSQGFWEHANDVRAAAAAAAKSNEWFSDILSLSYNHLPSHLKPCFLYMGGFPEDCEIEASRLIRLWVAEGILKSKGVKSLEEEAEDCLKDLVDRNLVCVRAVKFNGRPKRYGMHDLMRDLCLKKAEELRFVNIRNNEVGVIGKDSTYRPRHVFVQSSYCFGDINPAAEFMSSVRSFVCTGPASRLELSNGFSGLKLLKVLDVFEMEFDEFPREVLHMLNLRYLAFSYSSDGEVEMPSDITRLCNLQTLVLCFTSSACNHITLLPEILQMAELRHVVVYGGTIGISSGDWGSSGFILEKLQTIYPVVLSQEYLHRIPNIKKLGIVDASSIFDLSYLHKLEALRFSGTYEKALGSPASLRLPVSLRKLSLTKSKIVDEFMNRLCALPNLEVLKLQDCEFECGGNLQEWDAAEQEFWRLKFLLLERLQLVHWRVDETNFPRLRHLVIRECPALEEIPCGIGEIPTLQTIELFGKCRPSLVASAQLIIEEQRDNGNDELQLRM